VTFFHLEHTCELPLDTGPCLHELRQEIKEGKAEERSESCSKYLTEVLNSCEARGSTYTQNECEKQCGKSRIWCVRSWSYTRGNLESYTRGNLEKYTHGSLEKYTRDSLEDYTRDNFENYTRDNLDNYTRGNVENYTQGNLEKYTRDNFENYTRDNFENYTRDNFENYTRDNFENYTRDNLENYTRDNLENCSFAIYLMILCPCLLSIDPTSNTVCSRIWNPAKCQTDSKRFRFNAQTRTCDQFMFSGCLGNRNNFATESTCNQACSTGKLFFK
jgi:hypothetical protein